MDGEISVAALTDLIEHKRMLATDNAAGVRAVNTLLAAGGYARPAPHALDTTALDADLHDTMRDILANARQTYGPLRTVTLKDGIVTGQGSVVTRDGHLVRDSVSEFLALGRPPEGFTEADAGRFRLIARTVRRVEGAALLLKRPWWRNYGHWLIDSAATLALASRMRLPADWRIILGRQESPPVRAVVAQTVRLLAPGIAVLEHPDDEIWQVDDLIYPAPVHVPPLFKQPEGLAALRALVLRERLAPPAAHRRLFVSRGAHPARRLENEAELVAIAAEAGYEVVLPERLDLVGQAALFRAAAAVVGVKGAALANILFCAPGASVLVLSPSDFPDPFFWDLAAHAGAAYAELFGRLTARDRPRSHNPFRVDPARFAALLPR
jgi:capsular polysaccharide biosynthesis protein